MRLFYLIYRAIFPCIVLCGMLAFETAQAGNLRVIVSIVPQKEFVERVGGDLVDVQVLVPPGREPHVFEPTPRQMANLSKAQIYFTIGAPFEKVLLKKIGPIFKNLRVIDSSKGIKRLPMAEEEDDHESDDGHGHDSGEPDPHIWLDPILVKTIAENIREGLSKADPAHSSDFQKNMKAFQSDLDRVSTRIAKELAPFKGRKFFVFHPAFGYFGARYGLKQVAVETGGKEPTARLLARLIETAKREGAKVIFVQPQFSQSSADSVAKAIGGVVIPMDPLAEDYLHNLEEMAAGMEKALKTESKRR
ncbi:metal ABC transporter solute-binding protein, Zn/Mn family [Thermodesulfobacteriota bacterium]